MILLTKGCICIQLCFAGILALAVSWTPNKILVTDKLNGDQLYFLSLLSPPLVM